MTREQLDRLERILSEIEDVAFREVPDLIKTVRFLTTERDAALAEVARLKEQVEWLLEGREQQEQRLAWEIDE